MEVDRIDVTCYASNLNNFTLKLFKIPSMTSTITNEESNYIKIALLVLRIGPKAVRVIFDQEFHPSRLQDTLNEHQANLTRLYRQNRINQSQWKLLFPTTGDPSSQKFDISLMLCVLRNLAELPIGDKLPLSNLLKTGDDLTRIKFYRNKIAHCDGRIIDEEFEDYWKDIVQAILRLGGDSLRSECETLRELHVDNSQKDENLSFIHSEIRLQQVEESLVKLSDEVEELKSEQSNPIPKNIRHTHSELIKEWKKEDTIYCDETNVYKLALETVNSNNIITFVGSPGCGKTAMARHIALLFEEGGWNIVPVCEPKEIQLYSELTLNQVFVLDDVLGKFCFEMDSYRNLIKYEDMIIKSLGKQSKCLLTCRRNVFNDAVKLNLFITKTAFDMEKGNCNLNFEERKKILWKHCTHANVDPSLYENISFTLPIIMFPLSCKLFAKHVEYQKLGERFFQKPFKYLLQQMDQLYFNNTLHYTALVLCLLNKGVIDIKCLPQHNLKTVAFKTCGLDSGTADRKITDALQQMTDTYVTKIGNQITFTFIHSCIYEVIAYHYGKQFPENILKYMPTWFISTKVIISDNNSAIEDIEDLCIGISESEFPLLAERLYQNIQSMELYDVFTSKVWSSAPFVDVFIQTLRNKDYCDFKTLFFYPQVGENVIEETENILLKVCQKHFILSKEYKLIDAQYNLLRRMFSIGRERSYCITVVGLIVFYGHTTLLKNIVNLVKDNKESPDLVFGSDVYEQTRLLVLACFSGKEEIVELVLDYIDSNCINNTPLPPKLIEHGDWNRHMCLSPLTAAYDSRNSNIVEMLLKRGADINYIDKNGRWLLFIAAQEDQLDYVKHLIRIGADVNIYSERGSALYIASEQNNLDVVKCLIENGALVNRNEGLYALMHEKVPLLAAAREGHYQIVQYLVQNGAIVNNCNFIGGINMYETPLYHATLHDHNDIVRYLVENGADVNCNAPIYIASEQGNFEIVKCLAERGADVNNSPSSIFDTWFKSPPPLFIACMKGYIDIVNCLIQYGADIRQTDKDGVTPLEIALWCNRQDVVHTLIKTENQKEHSGNVHLFDILVNLFGNTCAKHTFNNTGQSRLPKALVEFILFSDSCLVEHLIKIGLNVNSQDEKGNSLLYNIITSSELVKERRNKVSLFWKADKNVIPKNTLKLYIEVKEVCQMFCDEISTDDFCSFSDYFSMQEYCYLLDFLKNNTRRNSI